MRIESIRTAREKRERLARAASHLTRVSKQVKADTGQISLEMLNTLPDWCTRELQQIRDLQRTCGALYFAPAISASIDGRQLRDFCDFTGSSCFEFCRQQEPGSHEVTAVLCTKKLPVSIMAAGSSVLLGTLGNDHLADLFEHLIGPRSVRVNADLSRALLRDAEFLLLEKPDTSPEQ